MNDLLASMCEPWWRRWRRRQRSRRKKQMEEGTREKRESEAETNSRMQPMERASRQTTIPRIFVHDKTREREREMGCSGSPHACEKRCICSHMHDGEREERSRGRNYRCFRERNALLTITLSAHQAAAVASSGGQGCESWARDAQTHSEFRACSLLRRRALN